MTAGVFAPYQGEALPKDALVVHAEAGWHDHILQGKCDFFEKLGQAVQGRGIAPILVRADAPGAPSPLEGGQRRIMVGPRRFRGPLIHHAFPAYIKGFWYLDPQGYFWNSSLMTRRFDPGMVDPAQARSFFQRVSRWRISNNVSQRKQAAPTALAPADVAVFTQDIELYADPVHYLTTRQMIRAAAEAVRGLCYVKPHPLATAEQRAWLSRLCARFPNAVLVDASVHDIIRAADVVVSQNSAVGFEALMHRKPVITCARTDYAAASLVCTTPQALQTAIARAPDHFATFPYEAYFYWFLGLNMLEPQHPSFTTRALRRLYGAGPEPA